MGGSGSWTRGHREMERLLLCKFRGARSSKLRATILTRGYPSRNASLPPSTFEQAFHDRPLRFNGTSHCLREHVLIPFVSCSLCTSRPPLSPTPPILPRARPMAPKCFPLSPSASSSSAFFPLLSMLVVGWKGFLHCRLSIVWVGIKKEDMEWGRGYEDEGGRR